MISRLAGLSIVHGRQGAGKTLFLVKYAFEHQNEYKKIYTNFDLKGIDYEHFDIVDWIIEKKEITNSMILIDEGQLFFNSRDSMGGFGRMAGWFFNQIRKRKNLVLVTSIPHQLDINLRIRACFFQVLPQPLIKIDDKYIPINPAEVLRLNLDISHFLIEVWDADMSYMVEKFVCDMSKYYTKYNTEQTLFPDWEKYKIWKRMENKRMKEELTKKYKM
jgi:hypothetical protein